MSESFDCLADEVIAEWVGGSLAPPDRETAERHLDGCVACRRLVSALAAGSSGDPETASGVEDESLAPRLLRPGERAGRFIILERLGAGGMGIVYAAHDPDLDRRVALKILFARGKSGSAGSPLLREAQAMARVVHPNVVAVHDVGTVNDRVFMAMEFVDGTTARQWAREKTRTVSEIVTLYVEAGRGIAAAHASGLVHRDFKPDNVLIGHDGRARVADFGLARHTASFTASVSAEAAVLGTLSSRGGASVQTATTAGTPAYVSPEQHEGEKADERSDQFSFCVALFEALYGVLPFEGSTLAERKRSVLAGQVRFPRSSARVPRAIRRVLLRGLSVKRSARYPSMAALLVDLAPTPRATRLAWLAAALLAVATIVLGLANHRAHAARVDACAEGDKRLSGIWDANRREEIARAFLRTDKPFAAAALAGVERALDEYARQWKVESRASCEATRLRSAQSEETFTLRSACFERRRDEVRALTSLLATAEADTVSHAVEAVQGLTPVAVCSDAAMLKAEPLAPSDTSMRSNVDRLRVRIAEVKAQFDSGKYLSAVPLAEATVRDAEALGYRPVTAEASYFLGALRTRLGEHKAAEEALYTAAMEAEASHHDRVAASSWRLLAWVVGYELRRHDAGHALSRIARSAIDRLGNPPDMTVVLDLSDAALRYSEGKYTESGDLAERAIATSEKSLASDSPLLCRALNTRANIHLVHGQYEQAVAMYQRALAVAEKSVGPTHPFVATYLYNLSSALSLLARFDLAASYAERALTVAEQVFGLDHLYTTAPIDELARARLGQGRSDDAISLLSRSMSIRRKSGTEREPLADPLVMLGSAYQAAGMREQALANGESGYAIRIRRLQEARARSPGAQAGVDDVEAVIVFASILRMQGQAAQALARAREGAELADRDLPPGHPWTARAHSELGQCQLVSGDTSSAAAMLERALGEQRAAEGDPIDPADTSFALAQALVKMRGDRARATRLAQEARAVFASSGPRSAKRLRDLDAWMTSLGN